MRAIDLALFGASVSCLVAAYLRPPPERAAWVGAAMAFCGAVWAVAAVIVGQLAG